MDLNLNWTQNKSLVVELLNGIENLQLASLQGIYQRNSRATLWNDQR
jgi:hypothetical protein